MMGNVLEKTVHCLRDERQYRRDEGAQSIAIGLRLPRAVRALAAKVARRWSRARALARRSLQIRSYPAAPPRDFRPWLLCALLLTGPAVAAPAKEKEKEAELAEVKTRIEKIQKDIAEDTSTRDSLTQTLKDFDLKIQGARARLAKLQNERDEAAASLADLTARRGRIEGEIAAERAELGREVRAAYMSGPAENLKLLLNQHDPATLGRMLTYYSYLGRARTQRIARVQNDLAQLEPLVAQIAATAAKLAAAEAASRAEVQALTRAREQRSTTLEAVQSRLRSRTDQLANSEREAGALEKLVEALRRAIDDFPILPQQPFDRVKGKLPWPVKGTLEARFGELRAGGPLKWRGVLIGAERGREVRAPFHGRVVYADWLPGLGLLLVLDHGDGYISLYGHNEQLFRHVGDEVSPGEVLATVGDSGHGGKPGLYLEIRKGKEPLNPLTWLGSP